MTYRQLQDVLPLRLHQEADMETVIDAALLVDGPVCMRENILYLAPSQEALSFLTAPETSECFSILLLEPLKVLPREGAWGRINLCSLNHPQAYRAVTEAMAKIRSQEQALQRQLSMLSSVLFSNGGNQRMLDCGQKLLQCPVIQIGLTEESFMAAWGPSPQTGVLEQIRTGKLHGTGEIMRKIFDRESIALLTGDHRPELLEQWNSSLGRHQMTVQIRVKTMEVGLLTILSCDPFKEENRQILRHLSVLVGQEMQKKSQYTRNPNEIQAQFLNHLVSSRTVSSDYIYQMTRLRSVTVVKDKFYLLVLESMDSQEPVDATLFSNLTAQLQSLLTHGLYLIRDTEMVILFNLQEKENIHALVDHVLLPKCEKYQLVAGISNMYRDLRETAKHYQQAKRSASLGAVYKDSALNYFTDIAPKEILHYMARHEDLQSFCVPEVLDLLNYDRENGTHLTDTLYVYLECVGNTARTAKILFLHKNTVLYRVDRIKEILQCTMETGEDVYKLMLSLRILRTLMLYTPPTISKPPEDFSAEKRKKEI